MQAMQDPTRLKMLAVRLTIDERRNLKAKAREERLSLSDYTRRALAMYGAIREAQQSYDNTQTS